MRDEEKAPRTRLTRRSLLRNAAVASGAAVLGATAITSRANAAAKVPQKLVSYQDHPHGNQRCDNCAQFEPPSSCKVVEGTIKPEGWCKVYVKKRST
jgi:High potential iron-sulfur protein